MDTLKTKKEKLIGVFDGIEIVIHAAAFKYVHLTEYNLTECIKTNVIVMPTEKTQRTTVRNVSDYPKQNCSLASIAANISIGLIIKKVVFLLIQINSLQIFYSKSFSLLYLSNNIYSKKQTGLFATLAWE